MKLRHLIIIMVSISLVGCGDDDYTVSPTTPPSQDITGTYRLSSASGNYLNEDGIFSFDNASSITGTLIIGQDSWNETYIVDGVTYSKNNCIYTVNYTTDTVEGTFEVVYQNGAGTYNFSIDGYNLDLTGNPNSRWTKISN